MRIAILTTDTREQARDYTSAVPSFGTAPQALLDGFKSLANLEVHVLSCLKETVPTPIRIGENMWFHALRVPSVGWMKTGYQGCVRAVREKLKELQPDIVHGQGTERDGAISAVFSGFPNVVTIHGNMRLHATASRPFSFPWLAAKLEGFTLPRTYGVICLNQFTRSLVKDVSRKQWVVPNAVDPRFLDVEPARSTPPLLLFPAEVCEWKNQNFFIRALDSLARTHRFRLLFAGSATPKNAYIEEFRNLIEQRPWCEFRGWANRPTLQQLMSEATGLVLPSLEENCPCVVLEAMAAKLPVAASRAGGIPELLEEGKNGILFDATSAQDTERAVSQLLLNPEGASQRALRAKEWANTNALPITIAKAHLEIYKEVAATSFANASLDSGKRRQQFR